MISDAHQKTWRKFMVRRSKDNQPGNPIEHYLRPLTPNEWAEMREMRERYEECLPGG